MNVVIFGPPGAGKGTQSAKLVKEFNLFQLSTGDLLRDEVNKKTEFGNKIEEIMKSGGLVSDEIINNLIENKVSNPEYKNRIIFDGFPRNLDQAKSLDNLLRIINIFSNNFKFCGAILLNVLYINFLDFSTLQSFNITVWSGYVVLKIYLSISFL